MLEGEGAWLGLAACDGVCTCDGVRAWEREAPKLGVNDGDCEGVPVLEGESDAVAAWDWLTLDSCV